MDTVLVIEDSRAMQRTLQRLFEADSARGANRLGRRGRIGNLQEANAQRRRFGFEAAAAFGQRELCRAFKTHMPSVPIVVLSANAEIEDKGASPRIGRADDYVTKPFSPRELLASREEGNAPKRG